MVKQSPPQLRCVETLYGPLTYMLTRKPVKNLNLRLSVRGEAAVSIPLRCSVKQADSFVREKSGWIVAALHRRNDGQRDPLPAVSPEECARLLHESLRRVYPLTAPLGITFPALKLRKLKSQWGNCHWAQGYITLNVALARCPEELRDYVALHELVHFLYHNHGSGFYAQMNELMPDWRQRRKELTRYSGVLDNETEGSESM